MSIIDSLSAGYRFVTERLYLLLLPILLDFALWQMPRLSIGTMVEGVADIYRDAAQMDELSEDLIATVEQASELLSEFGQQSNILNLLVNSSLYHVPSVMTLTGPLPNAAVRELGSPFNIIALAGLLSLAGLFIGVIYFGLLADRLPIGGGEKSQDLAQFLTLSFRRWVRTILLILIIVLIMLGIYVPITLGITAIVLFSPPLASLLMALSSGIAFVAFFYLYFATAGLVLDDLPAFEALQRSVKLVRSCFWPTFGFIILITLIGLGFSLIWMRIIAMVPAGTILAIAGNAYIGTGLAMALLVFYRTRTMMMEGERTLEEILEEV